MTNAEILAQGRYHVMSDNTGHSDFATNDYAEAKAKADEIARIKHVASVHDMSLDWNYSRRYLATPHAQVKFSELPGDATEMLAQDEAGNITSVIS